MVKDERIPSVLCSARKIRTHAEWKVEIHIVRATPPSICSKRSRISFAALFVKVMARISLGRARPAAMR